MLGAAQARVCFHLRLHDGDETGEASKLKQIAKAASIYLGMLEAGGMATYVVRAANCQVERLSLNAGFDGPDG